MTVEPRIADYTDGLGQINAAMSSPAGVNRRRLVLYIGSSIGNFSPGDALHLLRGVRNHLLPGECLLLGVDMVKDPRLMVAAYDDRCSG